MNIKPPQRNYNLTDPELIMFGYNLCQNITRDQLQFTPRGVTAGNVTSLHALVAAFELFPQDSYYQADVSIAVEAKDNTRSALDVKVRDVVQCAIIKWGADSPKVRKFGTSDISKYTDKEYLTACRQVVTTATGYLADLTPVGLTQPMIDAVSDGADTFLSNLDDLNEAITQREIKKGERIADGNEIYSFVSQYCTVGKIIWDDVDETKYNDYVIYPTSYPGLSKPQNVLAHWDPGDLAITLSWDSVLGATRYEVFVSIVATGSPSGNYNLLNSFTSSPQMIPPVSGKRNYFKIKAKNDTQTSDYSDEAWVEC